MIRERHHVMHFQEAALAAAARRTDKGTAATIALPYLPLDRRRDPSSAAGLTGVATNYSDRIIDAMRTG
jgi:hypothetical protein